MGAGGLIGSGARCPSPGRARLIRQEVRMRSDQRGRRDEPLIEVSTNGDAVVVRLGGELDLSNAAVVRRGLLDAVDGAAGRVIVDLAEVEFMDSTALAALLEARARLRDRERFLLAAPGLESRR